MLHSTNSTVLLLLVILLAAGLAFRFYLSRINSRYILERRGKVPKELEGQVDPMTLEKACDYHQARARFSRISDIYDTLLTILVVAVGFLPWLDTRLDWLTAQLTGGPFALEGFSRSLAFLVALGAGSFVLNLPFKWYSTFVLEEKFGFNKTTYKTFFKDYAKGLALAALFGIPLLWVGQTLFDRFPTNWWVMIWAVLVIFSLFVTWIFPEYLAPLFNRFWNLEDKELLSEIDRLSAKTGFELKRVQVMDASQRSAHSNAYFTGFGKTKKIVLFDTLMKQVSAAGIISVLAHELGHFKKGHVIKGIIISQVVSLLSLAILGFLSQQEYFYSWFGMSRSFYAAVVLFTIISEPFTFWFTPLSAWRSRVHEFEADDYAREIIGHSKDLELALVALSRENLSAPEPHPWFWKFYHSHPPILERVRALRGS